MRKVNEILRHPLYQEHYRRLEELEKDRIFCRHQMSHLLDVARIMEIRNLEEELGFSRELIYGAAVLHDIGKGLQYTAGIPHQEAGERLAGEILDDLPEEASFSPEERRMILTAIRGHRRLREDMEPLERLLCESDKASRMCFACQAESQCDWDAEKKNMEIKV